MPAQATRRPQIAQAEQLLAVEDLTGGLELRLSASLLKPNQSRLLRNWSLQEPGALVPFPGWAMFSTTSLGSARAQGGQRCYLDTATFTLAAYAGEVYTPSDAGVWGAAVLAGRSTTRPIYFPHDRTLAAVFDGEHIPQKTTNGSTWTQVGIDAPAAAPTLAAVNAGGTLINGNTYEVSYGYQDDALGHTGNESATATQAVATPNLTVRVTVVASTDPQVDKIVVYVRNVTAGETLRRKYAEYANTSTTRDITAATWTSNDEAPSDHTVPIATLKFAVPWKNRWWAPDAVVKNRIYFTQIFEPQSYPAFYYIDIPFERGDEIAAVVAQGDTLMVFGTTSKGFVIIGQTSLDFEVRPALGIQAGAFGARAADAIENGIVHVAAEGVYIYDGASDRLLSYNIDPGWRDLVVHSTATDLAMIAIVYHGLRKELRIGVPLLSPWGEAGEWVLDLNRTRTQEIPAWTSTDRPIGGYIHWNGAEATTGNRGRLFSWNLTTGQLREEATGTDADGADLVCDHEGATHATGGYVARIIDGYVEFQPAGGTFSVEAFVDGSGKGSQSIDIGSSLARYGSAIYGTDTYGSSARRQRPLMFTLSAEGSTVALRARYSGRSTFKYYTYKLTVMPEGRLRGL